MSKRVITYWTILECCKLNNNTLTFSWRFFIKVSFINLLDCIDISINIPSTYFFKYTNIFIQKHTGSFLFPWQVGTSSILKQQPLPYCSNSFMSFWICRLIIMIESFLWHGWPTNNVYPYFQQGPLSEILTIMNLQHVASRVWTCIEPEFRLSWTKLCSSNKHCTMAPQASLMLFVAEAYPFQNSPFALFLYLFFEYCLKIFNKECIYLMDNSFDHFWLCIKSLTNIFLQLISFLLHFVCYHNKKKWSSSGHTHGYFRPQAQQCTFKSCISEGQYLHTWWYFWFNTSFESINCYSVITPQMPVSYLVYILSV